MYMKAFIITLGSNQHSCDIAKECVIQAEKFGITVEFFDAINGKDFEEHYEKTGIPRPRKKFKKGRVGVLGCFFSHYYLWKKCAEENVPFIILEHDGFFIKRLPENILELFDDVLKLDRLDPYSRDYNTLIEQEKDKTLVIEKYYNSTAKNPAKVGTGNYLKGAYSYIIKPNAAKKLLDHIQNFSHVPADHQIGDLIVDIKTTVPTVARLHPFYSINDNIKAASLTSNDNLL